MVVVYGDSGVLDSGCMVEVMPIVRAQVSIPRSNTNSEDIVTNTWHFTTTGVSEGFDNDILTALAALYEGLDTYKSNAYLWSGTRVKMFNLEDSEPRVPIVDESLGLSSAPSGTPLPSEVAVCLSFNGEYVSGASQARRRGRIYFGPLNSGAMGTTGYLAASLLTAAQTACTAFLLASTTASDWAWVVYSPSSAQAFPVVEGFIDDAPDIQRRRGWDRLSYVTF